MNLKLGISAKFHKKVPTFFGERLGHIQYLETNIAKWMGRKGALPLMIPSVSEVLGIHGTDLDPAQYAEELDALVLQGGSDVHPRFYNEEPESTEYEFDEDRDLYELKLIEEFMKVRKPILGICRGFQLLNIYFRGTLHQELLKTHFSNHLDKDNPRQHSHEVKIAAGGVLDKIYCKKTDVGSVVSVHHQGIKKLGEGLFIEAHSMHDQLIEAFSWQGDNFVVGVQWHPEFHDRNNGSHLDAGLLFDTLLKAAKNRKFFGVSEIEKKPKVHFGSSKKFTLGGELEFQLVDQKTWDLKPACPEILSEVQSLRTKEEIFKSMIEVESDVRGSALLIEEDWKQEVLAILPVAEKVGVHLVGSGSHPFARTRDRLVTPGKRYQYLIEKNQWIARRIAIFGLHCHIGMENKEEAIRYYRFYLSIAPLLLALSASSAFWESEQTGLASVRSTFFEAIPSGGHPPILESWKHFEGLFSKMILSGAISSHKDLWWDVRPSLDYGTLEIRICDVMPTLEQNAALIALIHVLALAYEHQDQNPFPWPDLSEWSYRENKWRAARYGLNFDFILRDSAEKVSAREYMQEIFKHCEPLFLQQNYMKYYQTLLNILEHGTIADQQEQIFRETNDLREVVRSMQQRLSAEVSTF